jgi:hypothetical protein
MLAQHCSQIARKENTLGRHLYGVAVKKNCDFASPPFALGVVGR